MQNAIFNFSWKIIVTKININKTSTNINKRKRNRNRNKLKIILNEMGKMDLKKQIKLFPQS